MSASPRAFEIVPRGDYSLEQGASIIGAWHRAPSDSGELEQLAKKWSPYRMWVCVCLRRTLQGGAGMTHSRAAQ